MGPLRGKTIAFTESRRAGELARLIATLGGVPWPAPAVREVPRTDRTPALAALERICRGEVAVAIFLTGVGTRAFLDLAAGAGRRDALLAALECTLVVARGPKPVAVLRQAGVRVDLVPREPTSAGVLEALAEQDLRGKTVAVQLYGDDNPGLVEGLANRGAAVLEIPLYTWALPEDQAPLGRLIEALTAGQIDVIAFTSSPQVSHLFAVAERLGRAGALADALRERVRVAAIGQVCAASLRERGVVVEIQPDKGTMGALVHAIAGFLAHRAESPAESPVAR
ncbi:MAG TPA: uroporphyrinogen-III synthase [Calidithermus sp.]|nr:uroporphyrinogen-III synthase [Calidithermus sp.]